MDKNNIDKTIRENSEALKDILAPLDEHIDKIHPETFPNFGKLAAEAGNVIELDKKSKKQSSASRLRKIVAFAAVFVLVVAAAFAVPIVLEDSSTSQNKNISVENVSNEKSDPNDYTMVYNKLRDLKNRKNQFSFSDFLDEFSLFGSKNATAQDNAGAPGAALGGTRPNAESLSTQTTNKDTEQETDLDDYSETNAQVEGVSEADILKTDGKNLYYLRRNPTNNYSVLEIVEASKDGNLTTKSTYVINQLSEDKFFAHIDMYLVNNTLVIIGGSSENQKYDETGVISYDMCYYGGTNFNTEVLFFDVTDTSNIKRISKFNQEGGVISSRMVGEVVYLVSSYSKYDYNRVEKNNIKEFIPNVTNLDGSVGPIPADKIYAMPEIDSISYTVLSAISVSQVDKPNTIAVLGGGNEVYSNTKNLYVAGAKYSVYATDLLRFSISKTAIKLEATGSVNGGILNQFSMDEYKNYFRIATNAEKGNNIYVLDKELKLVGKVENLAKGEQLKSVRFMGDMGYIVTFLQVDPLFAIDLSNPKNPVLKSELKIPGFSSYMHPIDENTLVGIGTDGTDSGRTFGVKFSMFDVTDSENVSEKHKLTIGQNADSPAAYNHKAITYIEKSGLFIIPVRSYDNDYYLESNNEFFIGYYVVKFDKTSGFKVVAKIPSTDLQGDNGEKYGDIYFEDYRSAYIGNYLYTVCYNGIISVSMDNFVRADMLLFEIYKNIDGYYGVK